MFYLGFSLKWHPTELLQELDVSYESVKCKVLQRKVWIHFKSICWICHDFLSFKKTAVLHLWEIQRNRLSSLSGLCVTVFNILLLLLVVIYTYTCGAEYASVFLLYFLNQKPAFHWLYGIDQVFNNSLKEAIHTVLHCSCLFWGIYLASFTVLCTRKPIIMSHMQTDGEFWCC